MTIEQVLALYYRAQDLGIVDSIKRYASCESANGYDCKKCPASPACKFLTSLEYFPVEHFETNFDSFVRPHLSITKDQLLQSHPEYFL